MLVTIACVAIFSAFIIFFVDELAAHLRTLANKPFVFLGCSLLLASTGVVIFSPWFLWAVIGIWVQVLAIITKLTDYFALSHGWQWFIKWLMLLLVVTVPFGMVTVCAHYKKFIPAKTQAWRQGAYELSIFLSILLLLLFGIA